MVTATIVTSWPCPPRAAAAPICSRISERSCCAETSASFKALSRSRKARSCSWKPRAFADLGTELLRADEGVVERLVALAEGPQLLVEALGLGLELHQLAAQALQLVGHLGAELLDALRLVATHGLAEVVAPHVERRQVKCLVH